MKLNTQDLIFHSVFEVSFHGSLKNDKIIRQSGFKRFIGTKDRTKALKNEIVAKLMQSSRKAIYSENKPYLTNINFPIRAQFLFIYAKDILITKRQTLNMKSGDLSNLYQLPEDALQSAGILENDCWIKSHSGSDIMISPDNKFYLEISLFKLNDFKYKTYKVALWMTQNST